MMIDFSKYTASNVAIDPFEILSVTTVEAIAPTGTMRGWPPCLLVRHGHGSGFEMRSHVNSLFLREGQDLDAAYHEVLGVIEEAKRASTLGNTTGKAFADLAQARTALAIEDRFGTELDDSDVTFVMTDGEGSGDAARNEVLEAMFLEVVSAKGDHPREPSLAEVIMAAAGDLLAAKVGRLPLKGATTGDLEAMLADRPTVHVVEIEAHPNVAVSFGKIRSVLEACEEQFRQEGLEYDHAGTVSFTRSRQRHLMVALTTTR